MSQFQVEIVNVSPPTTVKTARGGYHVIEVAYKYDGKVSGKKIIDFAVPETYAALNGASAGQNFLIVSEKDDKGYNQWVSANRVEANQPEQAEVSDSVISDTGRTGEPVATASAGKVYGRVTGNNYETPEERATKQATIVRQAMLNAAIESNPGAETEEILTLARKYEDFVYTDLSARAASYQATVAKLKK